MAKTDKIRANAQVNRSSRAPAPASTTRASGVADTRVSGRERSGASHTQPPAKKKGRAKAGSNGTGHHAEGKGASGGSRRLGLRGAAPWAARHAAKHAAEARARNAEPPKPGSARATLREPQGAEEIKARIGELHGYLSRIQELRKGLRAEFFEIGAVLRKILEERLYEAKGYATFEHFVDRETGLGKSLALDLARIVRIFQPSAAATYGLEALLDALRAIDESGTPRHQTVRRALPSKPPRRIG
jgi:hypothetical protein